MKRISLLIALFSIFGSAALFAQPTLVQNVNFENGMPSGWTATANVDIQDAIPIEEGGHYLRIKPNTVTNTVVSFTSPTINIDANKDARLEFNHIPMLPVDGSQSVKAQVYLVINGVEKELGATEYDKSYGGGMTEFVALFHKNNYWAKTQSNASYADATMWKHEVFMLKTATLNGATSFQVKFKVSGVDTTKPACVGWLLDDIKVFVASVAGDEVNIPQIGLSSSVYPEYSLYPNCSDAQLSFLLKDAGGLSSIEDSIYVVYRTQGDEELTYVPLSANGTVTGGMTEYIGSIPFLGIDTTVYWKLVVNDEVGNVTTYPFTGYMGKFTYVKPYVGSDSLKTSGISSQEVFFNTSNDKVMFQMRYDRQELLDAGYSPGKIAGLYVKITSVPSTAPILPGFKLDIGNLPHGYTLTKTSPHKATPMTNAINKSQYIVPQVGWQYLPFDSGVDFVWDGESDILIKVCYEGVIATGATKVACIASNASGYETRALLQSMNTAVSACTGVFNSDADGTINYKPNFRFNFVNICYFQTDAGVRKDTILSPTKAVDCSGNLKNTVVCAAGTPATLKVMLRNDGLEELHSLKVNWMLDGDTNTKQSSIWNGTMLPLNPTTMLPTDTAVVFTLTSNYLPPAGVHKLYVWTEMNDDGMIDWNYDNDTAIFTLIVTDGKMSGTYAIGGEVSGVQPTRTFATFDDAFLMLMNSEVKGECTFKIKTDEDTTYYIGHWTFPSCIEGLTDTNRLFFTPDNAYKYVVFAPSAEDSATNVFDLSNAKYITFNKLNFTPIAFVSQTEIDSMVYTSETLKDIIKLNDKSVDIKFFGCQFDHFTREYDFNKMSKIKSLINILGSDSITVNWCTFNYPATYSVFSEGVSPVSPNTNLSVEYSIFNINKGATIADMSENSVYVRFSKNLNIMSNTFESKYTDGTDTLFDATKYATLLSYVDSAKVHKNIYILKSASALSLSDVNNSIIANNRISIWFDSSKVSYTCNGIALNSGENNSIVYNNLFGRSLKSYARRVVGMNLGYQTLTVKNNIVKNNIALSDGYGYAVLARPSDTNVPNSFKFSNNFYYKTDAVENIPLLSFNGSTSTTVESWIKSTKEDSSFYDQNPFYKDWNNLSTVNILLCEAGTHIDSVKEDCFGNPRPTASQKNPCIGAREFDPPDNNIYVTNVGVNVGNYDGENTYTGCDMTKNPVFVEFTNMSKNSIGANKVKIRYSVNGVSFSPITVDYEIKPDSVYKVEFPGYNFTATDGPKEYELKGYSVFASDTVNYNDTAVANIVALYQEPAPNNVTVNINYGESVVVSVTNNDSVYWFKDKTSDEYFHKGETFTTSALYADTTFYFSAKKEETYLKITEIQFSKAAAVTGQTEELPSYVTNNNVYEISNLGNAPIDLTGYKFIYYKAAKNNDTLKNATSDTVRFHFPEGYTLAANSAVVLVPASKVMANADEALAIKTTITFKDTAKVGFVLTDATDKIVDAVALNNAKFAPAVNANWTGTSVKMNSIGETAGVKLVKDGTGYKWQKATTDEPMTIGKYDDSITYAKDNGCYGYKAEYKVHIPYVPSYDPGLTDIWIEGVKETAACNVTKAQISVKIANTGKQTLTKEVPMVCNFYETGQPVVTIKDTFKTQLASLDTTIFTFSTPFDFSAYTAQRNITIEVYPVFEPDSLNKLQNDTVKMEFISKHTPKPPVASDVTIPYATSTLLTATSDYQVIWYDDPTTEEELDRGDYQTPVLYTTDTFYVGALIQKQVNKAIGKDSVEVGTTEALAYPSPFNTIKKNIKEQYLLTAEDLKSYGYEAGNINDISFKIKNITLASGQTMVSLHDYTIKMGMTDEEELTEWIGGLKQVYTTDSLVLKNQQGWYKIELAKPYYWDGESNLAIEISFSALNNKNKVTTYTSSTTYPATISYRHATTDAASWTGSYTSAYNKLPFMKFTMDVFGCAGDRVPVVVTVQGQPTCDAGITQIVSPVGPTVMSDIEVPVEVEIKNFGADALTGATVKWSVNSVAQTPYTWTGNLASGQSKTVTVGNYTFSSGLVKIEAVVVLTCDTINSNDTASVSMSACIGNNEGISEYTIDASSSTADYSSLKEAVSELTTSGICGPVVFKIASGTYDGQLNIPSVVGSSEENTITFKALSDDDKPVITFSASSSDEDKSVMVMDGTNNVYFENLTFKGKAATNPTLIRMSNTENINFTGVTFEQSLVLVQLEDGNTNTNFVKDTFKTSTTSIASKLTDEEKRPSGLNVKYCVVEDFLAGAFNLESYNNVNIAHNDIKSLSTTVAANAVRLVDIQGYSTVEANYIYMKEGTQARNGIVVRKSKMTEMDPLYIYNNSVSILSSKNVNAVGIDIDSSSNIMVYYNTVFMNVGNKNTKAIAMSVEEDALFVTVRNNNFDNHCGGYAYLVNATGNQVILSNNNNYYTTGSKLAKWVKDCADFDALKAQNGTDFNSCSVMNPFTSDSDLSLLYPTDIVRAAEPLEDIMFDIRDTVRPVSTKPTMGAYEYIFDNLDAGVTEFIDPKISDKYIEEDPVDVSVVIKNFGNYTMQKFKIVAELKYHDDDNTTIDKIEEEYEGTMSALDTIHYTFTQQLYPPLNTPLTDSLYLAVYTILDGDTNNVNDTLKMHFITIPGKNLQLASIQPQEAGTAQCGANMRNQVISVIIKNVGNKAVTAADNVQVTYEVKGQSGLTLSKVTETLSFPYNTLDGQTFQDLQPGSILQYYSFNTTVDLYPINYADTTWNIQAYLHFDKDHVLTNDTAKVVKYKSIVSPNAPVAEDDNIEYATWGHPKATQEDGLKIQWFASTSDPDPFYAPSTYAASQVYATPQLYADTSFFVKVDSKGSVACPSEFTEVKVIIKPRCQVDLAALAIVEPPALPDTAYVYMQADSVRVSITNYGTAPQVNFPVTYKIKPAGKNAEETVVTEICTTTVMPDDTITYVFDALYDYTTSTTFDITAWVDADDDCAKINDTSLTSKIQPRKGLTDDIHSVSDEVSLDITRVMLATLDNSSMAFDDGYSDYTESIEPAVLFRGLQDSLIVYTELASEQVVPEGVYVRGWMKAWIDWNRDGTFAEDEEVYSDTIIVGEPNRGKIAVPATAKTGYTRMRIIAAQNNSAPHAFGAMEGIGAGEIEDYKIFVRKAEKVNAELMHFVSPDVSVSDTQQTVVVRLRNAGLDNLTSAKITWTHNDGEPQVFNWTGSLASSQIQDVTLATVTMPLGSNKFNAYVDTEGDEYHANDTVNRSAYVYHTYTIPYATEFDEQKQITYDNNPGGEDPENPEDPDDPENPESKELVTEIVPANDDFHPYEISEIQPSNCWQLGIPDNPAANAVITSAYSEPYCWKTNLTGNYPANNSSILYSPVFDVEVVKPDTLSFMLRKAMGKDASLVVEYLNYAGSWMRLGTGTAKDTSYSENWYNSEKGFTGTNAAWTKCVFALDSISGNIGTTIQFRFVFKSGKGAVGEGVAIDNFSIARARRDQDAGVVGIELTPTKLPNYGQKFYPKVQIANFGKQDLTSFKVCYMSEDMYIAQCEDVWDMTIHPRDTAEYTFKNGRYLDLSMPDPFTLVAFTRLNPADLYSDNDSLWTTFVIGPLLNDAAIMEIIEPKTKVVSNDNINISIRIKNYGLTPIDSLPVGYLLSGYDKEVTETAVFNPPLINGDEYVYNFTTPFKSSFGKFNLKTWVGLDNDDYHDNDTLYRRIEGSNATQDFEAKRITLDATENSDYGVQIAFFNRSNVGVKDIQVGYLLDGDNSTKQLQAYREGYVLEANSMGYQMFDKRIPKKQYNSICAFVNAPNEVDRSNDTTCSVYIGYYDLAIDSIMIEEGVQPDCKVQVRAHNAGTLGGKADVTVKFVLDNNWNDIYSQKFTWGHNEPREDRQQYMTFNRRIPKSSDHTYNIVAWLEYSKDHNHINDTTRKYGVYPYVGLDSVETNVTEFVLEQNQPNPAKDRTTIGFAIPQAGQVTFTVTSVSGQILYTFTDNYSEGHHVIDYQDADKLTPGVYYYSAEYNGQRKSRKMVVVK